MRIGMIMAAVCCLVLGILPTIVIDWMDAVPAQLVGTSISPTAGAFGWMWLTPVAPERARELCVVGIVARASGMNLDCRIFNPFPPYDKHHYLELDVPVLISGDVHERAWVRIQEIRESLRIIRKLLDNMPDGEIAVPVALPGPDTSGFAAVEGWRGEIIYWLQAGPKGEINRCMVRDPSSVNWPGLEQAVLGNIVPDFPLCNKSFNQSYSGHDL